MPGASRVHTARSMRESNRARSTSASSPTICELTSAPGIGKRIAQRILLELKDKMAKESASVDCADLMPAVPASDSASAARSDAIAGLTVLGYSMPEINAALRTLPSIEGMSADQIIKAALRAMMQQ